MKSQLTEWTDQAEIALKIESQFSWQKYHNVKPNIFMVSDVFTGRKTITGP